MKANMGKTAQQCLHSGHHTAYAEQRCCWPAGSTPYVSRDGDMRTYLWAVGVHPGCALNTAESVVWL